MNRKKVLIALCAILVFLLTACNPSGEKVEPKTANVVLSEAGNASLKQESEGDFIIENFSAEDYAEWIIDIKQTAEYKVEIEYSSEDSDFGCIVELYSEDGKLQSEVPLKLSGTGSFSTFNTVLNTVGELEKGAYTFIIRSADTEGKSINIKSVKLVP